LSSGTWPFLCRWAVPKRQALALSSLFSSDK
jgi:hypothetical protein